MPNLREMKFKYIKQLHLLHDDRAHVKSKDEPCFKKHLNSGNTQLKQKHVLIVESRHGADLPNTHRPQPFRRDLSWGVVLIKSVSSATRPGQAQSQKSRGMYTNSHLNYDGERRATNCHRKTSDDLGRCCEAWQ